MAASNNVAPLYRSVVDDVINNVRESFLDEGCDEQILQELKQLWENKLSQSKSVEGPPQPQANPAEKLLAAYQSRQTALQIQKKEPGTVQQVQIQQQRVQLQPHEIKPTVIQPQVQIQQQPGAVQHQVPLVLNADGSALQLSSAAQQATVALPTGLYQQPMAFQPGTIIQAGAFLQGFPGAFIQGQGGTQFIVQAPGQFVATQQPAQTFAVAAQQPGAAQVTITQGGTPAARPFIQTDGPNDSSSEDDDDDDRDDDDDDDDDNKDDENEDEQGEEEEPLNSDDDISDADPSELFDTDNVVVCQYDKINRAKNRWKFHLKDGIMNLNGKDHVFQKATGDADW